MINKLILSAMGVLISLCTHSQNREVIPPSPTATAFAKYVDNPVSLYTGTPDITIPLYTIELSDFSLPISLSYLATGIKVEEQASNVGLGWVLNAGGLITRAVHGFPDDVQNDWKSSDGIKRDGLFYTPLNLYDIDFEEAYEKDADDPSYSWDNILSNYFNLQTDGVSYFYTQGADTEPDVFYYNFAGHSGEFIFSVVDGVPTIKPLTFDDLVFSFEQDDDGQLIQFQIIDDHGVTYTFAEVESASSIDVANSSLAIWDDEGNQIPLVPDIELIETDYGYSMTFPITVTYDAYILEYNSGWYLSKIETPSGETVRFGYSSEASYTDNLPLQQTTNKVYEYLTTYDPKINGAFYSIGFSSTSTYGKRISTIGTDDVEVGFVSEEREDLAVYDDDAEEYGVPKAITGIKIRSLESDESGYIKSWTFEQDYFETPEIEEGIVDGIYLKDGSGANFKRLRLLGIQEYGDGEEESLPATTFEYKYSDFGYGSDQVFPHKLSNEQDLWGFFNAASENLRSLIPQLYVYPDMYSDSRRFSVYERKEYTGRKTIVAGANRLPNSSYTDVGMLTKINYPSGGYTQFEYEPHVFVDDLSTKEEFEGGGLRIKSIVKSSGNNSPDIVYSYSYTDSEGNSSGRLIGMPVYGMLHPKVANNDDSSTDDFYLYGTSRYNRSQAPLATTHGSPVGYRMVTEAMEGNGKTVSEFAMPALWYDRDDYQDCSISVNGECYTLYHATTYSQLFPLTSYRVEDFKQDLITPAINTFPFANNPNYDWVRGNVLKSSVYNNEGTLIQTEDFSYNLWFRQDESHPFRVYGIKFGFYNPYFIDNKAIWGDGFIIGKYFLFTDAAKVLKTHTLTRKLSNGSEMQATTQYAYKGQGGIVHKHVIQETHENSEGDKTIIKYKYPADYVDDYEESEILATNSYDEMSKAIMVMANENILTPVEELTIKGEKVISGSLHSFKVDDDHVFPHYDYQLALDEPVTYDDSFLSEVTLTDLSAKINRYDFKMNSDYELKGTVGSYDSRGNILEYKNEVEGYTTSYIWGYYNKYPVAKIINAEYSEVNTVLGNTLSSINEGWGDDSEIFTDEELRDLLAPLREGLPDAQVYTYTYDPLIGMTSATDPAGITTYYEYDSFGRLSLEKDTDGNILKEYEYNYMTEE